MSNKVITLDSIREAVSRKYAGVTIPFGDSDVELVNVLRLPKKKRDAIQTKIKSLQEDGADQEKVVGEVLVLASSDETKGKALVAAIDGDLAVLMEVLGAYTGSTQAGGSLGLAGLIDDYGEGIYPDLLREYGVDLRDVVAGTGPSPDLVISMVLALPRESLTKALMRGSREYEGWSLEMEALAAVFDHIALLTEVSGRWKDKPPKLDRFPRPGDAEKKALEAAQKKPRSLADVFASFGGGGNH